jgi:release factor glutamine methyltransferase
MNTIKDILNWATEYLKNCNISSAHLDSEILLSFILHRDRTYLYQNSKFKIQNSKIRRFEELIERRGRNEPVSYIIGEKEFWSLKFKVTHDTLIPRPETEILVQAVLDVISPPSPPPLPAHKLCAGERIEVRGNNILDIGTGCGNIAVSVAVECHDCHILAVDKSDASLSVAKENAIIHNVAGRITFLKGDLYSPFNPPLPPLVRGGKGGFFDIIVSNPPYIPTEDIKGLMPEVKDWEPIEALDGGKDGLEVIKKIINAAPEFLKPTPAGLKQGLGGCIVMEIGFGQAEDVRNIIKETGKFSDIKVIKDLSDIERVIVAELGHTKK